MNGCENNRPKEPCNLKVVPTKSPRRKNDLKNPSTPTMPLDNISLINEEFDVLPIKNDVLNTKKTDGDDNKSVKGACSIGNVAHDSNDYLLDYCNQNVTFEPNSNHKFYGCKRRDYPNNFCESFGLPDDPIFANSPLFLDTGQSPLDANLADPGDICVVNLDYINQPWLIEDQEVVTPYWDVESLFPFEIDDIRYKIDRDDLDLSSQNDAIKGNLESSINSSGEEDNVFTSTPLKGQSDSVNVVSTINIANTDDESVDIALLKDQVLKALEEAIKKKSTMTNIDMKIQIVADLNRSPKTLSRKPTVQVRINESIDTESCQPSSSTKQNYSINNGQLGKKKLKKPDNSKNARAITLSDWNEDWQDSQEQILIDHEDELSRTKKIDVTIDSSAPIVDRKKTKHIRKINNTLPSNKRSLKSDNDSKIPRNLDRKCLSKKVSGMAKVKRRIILRSRLNRGINEGGKEIAMDPTEHIHLDSPMRLQKDKSSLKSSKKRLTIQNELRNHEIELKGVTEGVTLEDKGSKSTKMAVDPPCHLRDDKHKKVADDTGLECNQYTINSTMKLNRKDCLDGYVLKKNLSTQGTEFNFKEISSKISKNNILKIGSNLNKHTAAKNSKNTKQRRITRSSFRNESLMTSQDETNTRSSSAERVKESVSEPISKKAASILNINGANKPESDKQVPEESCIEEILFKKSEHELDGISTRNILFRENSIQRLDISPDIVERRVTRSSLRNELSSQSESDLENSIIGRPKHTQLKSQKCFHLEEEYRMERKNDKKEKLPERIKIAATKYHNEAHRVRPKHRTSDLMQKRLSRENIVSSTGPSETTLVDDSDEEPSFRRTLRSSNKGLQTNADGTKQQRKRTVSSNFSDLDINETCRNILPRKRSVSVNFDGHKNEIEDHSPLERRRLRSHVAEGNISTKLNSTDCSTDFTSLDKKIVHNNFRSPRISFDLNKSGNDSTKNIQSNTQLKGILKNSWNDENAFSSQSSKQICVPSLADMKCDAFDDLPLLTREDSSEEELDDKKENGKVLKDNGITSRVRVVISPFDIRDENCKSADKKCPILPLELSPESKTRIISDITEQYVNEDNEEDKARIRSDLQPNEGVVDKTVVDDALEIKEVKNENIVYNIGNIVWAQVARYPYWPGVVCKDPDTDAFFKEEIFLRNRIRVLYHIRFFGDSGKRAWVKMRHVMLYSSKHDLEMIAKKLKSENKNYSTIKPYLVGGGQQIVEKWNKAIEEMESLQDKTPEEVINYLVESYESFVKKRREKRKLNTLDASSESESEDPETIIDRPRRKRYKASYNEHVTADVEFNEINISMDPKNNIDIFDVCSNTKLDMNNGLKSSSKPSFIKSRNNLKDSEMISNNSQNKSLEHCPLLEIADKNIIDDDPFEITAKMNLRRSRRSLKHIEKVPVSDSYPQKLENSTEKNNAKLELYPNLGLAAAVNPTKNESPSNLPLPANLEKMQDPAEVADVVESEANVNNQQFDEASEVGSKSSDGSSSNNSNMYSFEYQVELHKKNSLFNGLRNVKVCDYCMKQGDLYKCKGKCGGFFHLECASRVTQPRKERRHKNKEKSPMKAKSRLRGNSVDSTPKSKRSEDCCRTRSQSQCQIITIKSRHIIATPKKDNLPDNFHELSLGEQIDYGMKEMMSKFDDRTVYLDLTDSGSEEGCTHPSHDRQLGIMDSPASTSGSEKLDIRNLNLEDTIEEEKSSDDLEVSLISENAITNSIKHVTADSVILTESETPMDITNLKCTYCRLENNPPCYSCGLEVSKRGDNYRQKCSQFRCGRYYHPHCLKMWPQTQWSIGKWSKHQQPEDSFTCPAHTCHTCFSEELGSTAACRLPGDRLARCLLCPAAFHTTTFCIPAGTEILGGSQIVCPRHRSRPIQPINTVWCFICSEGGNLVCCDTCPTSVHPECQPVNYTDDDKYICEDCESGRFPLYDEIVWVKLGQYRWWPAIVLFPNEVPENVRAIRHQRGDFAVRFFGTNDHYWVNKSRSFLFQEGDRGGSPGESTRSKNKVYETFGKSIEDAAIAYKLKKEFKLRREAECISSLKPPSYIRINKNRPVGNVKCLELNLSNATACECDPNKSHPCGSDSNCINRLLMTECDPDICRAGIRCRNQAFQKRDYPPMVPYKTQGRGWGLKALAPIKMGQFVIEYCGELIDSEEYQRRIKKMHEKKEENYYFMTVDSDRMIDAGPKGNLSRFMNHSCNPNCVTQKWTVKGDTRVGLFARCDIETGSELTFNYNLEVVGQEKKVCKCGATNCSGYIGVKAKLDKSEKSQVDALPALSEQRRSRKLNKKPAAASPPLLPPCFTCGKKKSDVACNNKFCNKGYHLKCLKLDEMPDASKYACPRHNCNICSNRTIRCCVKCTNSFCPSHSEGNVRHDKFLGFVCRLHDPGISPTDESLEPAKEAPKRKTESRKRRVSLCVTQKAMNKTTIIAGKEACSSANERTSRKSTLKQFHRRRIQNRFKSLSLEEKEVFRAKWRISTRKYRLKIKAKELETIRLSDTNNADYHDNDNNISITPGSNVNDTAAAEGTGMNIRQVDEMARGGNQIVTSKSNSDTHEVPTTSSSSSAAERLEFNAVKPTRRGRLKPDTTDESAVSSTTSDEGSASKPPDADAKRTCQPEHDRTFEADRNDQVSSSPIKRTRDTSEDELSLTTRLNKKRDSSPDTSDDELSLSSRLKRTRNSSSDTSEDELSLSTRLKRMLSARKPRKESRLRFNGLSSTAKPS